MNASRLKEFLDLLIDLEAKNRIQESLNEVVNTLGRLAAEPQNASIQSEFAQQLDQFKASTASTQASIEPAKIPLLQEIGADKYFIRDFPEEISSSIRENPLTPAVTQQKLQPIARCRWRSSSQR